MLLSAARDLHLDLAASAMFGDKVSDLQAAQAAGVPLRVLLGTDGRDLPSAEVGSGLATLHSVASIWLLKTRSLLMMTNNHRRRHD